MRTQKKTLHSHEPHPVRVGDRLVKLEPRFHRKLIFFVAKDVQVTILSFEFRQDISQHCSFKYASASGDPSSARAQLHPPSSCRARQLQARQPRRIPRFITSIHNRRIHNQRLLPPSSPSTCRVPDTESPRRPHPPQRTYAPPHSSYLRSLPSYLSTSSVQPPQHHTPY